MIKKRKKPVQNRQRCLCVQELLCLQTRITAVEHHYQHKCQDLDQHNVYFYKNIEINLEINSLTLTEKKKKTKVASVADEVSRLDAETKHRIVESGFEPTLATLSNANWRVFGMLLPTAALTLHTLSNDFVLILILVMIVRNNNKKKNVIFIYLFIYHLSIFFSLHCG
jgi:surface polysaccharide O-acyltransferase-like enzyme